MANSIIRAPLADAIETVLAAIPGSSREGALGVACNTLEDFAVNHCGDDSGDPRAPAAIALLREAAGAWRREFETDEEVNGGDVVEWLGDYQGRVKAFLETAPEPEPARIIVVMEEGLVAGVACDRPARVLALDCDIEGADDPDLELIDGKLVWASLYDALPFADHDERSWADGLNVRRNTTDNAPPGDPS